MTDTDGPRAAAKAGRFCTKKAAVPHGKMQKSQKAERSTRPYSIIMFDRTAG